MEKSDNGMGEMRIAGIASTASEDRQGDIIPQDVLDISEFLDSGFLNYDHNNEKILGYPDRNKTKFTKDGLYVEGVLLPGIPLAEEVYQTAKALQESGSDRRYGFSVEGYIQERDTTNPKKIRRAKVTNLAITPTPVNQDCTWEVVKKSMITVPQEQVLIPESLEKDLVVVEEAPIQEGIVKALISMKANGSTPKAIGDVFLSLTESTPDIRFLDSQSYIIQMLITGKSLEEII
jgi:caudovirus prohead protease